MDKQTTQQQKPIEQMSKRELAEREEELEAERRTILARMGGAR